MRVGEDEVPLASPAGPFEVAFELASEEVAHRDASAAVGLRRVERAARVALGDAKSAGGPVDVAPPEADQLALAQAGHCGGEVQRAFDGSEVVVRDRSHYGGKLL